MFPGGTGPVIVFVHGLIMDGSLWRRVVADLHRDLRKYVRSAAQGRRDLLAAMDKLAAFDRPALIAWASEDQLMPPKHGRRLAELLPHGHLVEIPDSYTLIPEDQPAILTAHIREFLTDAQPTT